MIKKHKRIVALLILILCLIFAKNNEADNYTYILTNRGNLNLEFMDNHNIVSRNSEIKYIGHRGIGGLAPENTIPSFELAGRLGFWGAECDVHTTSDGNWMILHDDTVDRTTNGTGHIKDLSISRVQSLIIDSGNNINNYKRNRIPQLQDYLVTCEKWGLVSVIEMKPANNIQYYDKFIETIKKYGSIDKTVVISSSFTSLNELRKRDIYLTLGLICPNITDDNINYVKALGNAFIDCSFNNITSSEVTLCHKNNIKVGAWTVDNKALADKLIQKGVDYLTTNKLVPEGEI